MGKLITFAEAKPKSLWYFEDASYSTVPWPSISFPYHVFIHADNINNHPKTRIKIRRFIENNLTDTVIYDVIEKDYYKFFTEDHSWDRKWDVKNSWVRFHFEEEQSMLVFAIAFCSASPAVASG